MASENGIEGISSDFLEGSGVSPGGVFSVGGNVESESRLTAEC